MKLKLIIASLLAASAASAFATADTYTIDPNHTYPSFTADHMGISFWRGKFEKTSGSVTLDRAAKTGSIDIHIDPSTIDFGHAKMNEHASGPDMFDVKKFPDVKTASWCKLQENAGVVLNVSTGKPLAPTDECWKTGVGIGYQEAATKKAHEDALSFFKEVFK